MNRISPNNRKIIDFHQHCLIDPNKLKLINSKHKIIKSIQIPLDFGKLSWSEVLTEIELKIEKSERYKKNILYRIPEINDIFYKKINDINFKSNFFEFVPWLQVSSCLEPKKFLNNINKIINEKWLIKSKIIKIIPIFDDIYSFSSLNAYYLSLQTLIDNIKKNYMIHTGWGSSPTYLATTIEKFPDRKFIIAHMKEDNDMYNKARIRLLMNYNNVYVETSYLSSPKRIKQYIDLGFEDKILFGSDFRNENDIPSLKWFINAIELADITEKQKNKIFYENANKLI